LRKSGIHLLRKMTRTARTFTQPQFNQIQNTKGTHCKMIFLTRIFSFPAQIIVDKIMKLGLHIQTDITCKTWKKRA